MKTATDVIAKLEAHNGKLEKEQIVKDAFAAGIFEFFEAAAMAYNKLRSFGVKQVPLIEDEDEPGFVSTFTWDHFKILVAKLESRELTGNAARDALRAAADKCTVRDWNGFYRRVLIRDFKCGAGEGTINRALADLMKATKDKKIKAELLRHMVPEFSVQLAKNGDDHPKKMTGIKLLDPKLDGCRLTTIIDIVDKTVTQYTRHGAINDRFTNITTALAKLIPLLKRSVVLDGEVVSQNFQQMMTQLNRKTADTRDAKLALFDIIALDDFKKLQDPDPEVKSTASKITQTKRHEELVELIPLLQQVSGDTVYVIPKLSVDLNTVEGQQTFKEFNNTTVAAGFEGIMVKDPMASYECDRTFAWLKIKPFITVDLEIIDVLPGNAGSKYEKTLGRLVCKGEEQGKKVKTKCGGGFSDKQRDEIWTAFKKNPKSVIGLIVEIKGDCLTLSADDDLDLAEDEWSVRFPVFMRFRGQVRGEKI
jgi:DNA ligase-1